MNAIDLLQNGKVMIVKTYSEDWGGNQIRCTDNEIAPAVSARDYKDPLRVVYVKRKQTKEDCNPV